MMEEHQGGEFLPVKADAKVWRKRLTQIPEVLFNWREWTLGFSWDAPEDEGFFYIHLGPIGISWDMWP